MAKSLARPEPFTYDDYRLLPEDGKIHELMEGDFFVSPAPSPWHQTVSRRLQAALMKALEEPGLAFVFNAPTDVILEPTSVVQPDIVVLGAAKKSFITHRAIEGIPDLIIEILSPGSLDRDGHIKRKLYQRLAVPEYWIVDPDHGLIRVLRYDDDSYGDRARYDRSSTATSPDFPTLELPLAPIFAPL
ncbi:MAG TPA: Uma2 family endonuclease [Polyangia bacterium]|jgi:Uma2 family endonuclease|nr:Uma2 family endonuclease [Polyangia bacterium]